jgi:plastocyanin
MRGLPPLLALAAGLVLAAPAAAAEQTVTFPNGGPGSYSYSPANPSIKTGDKVTFSGPFASHPLVWDSGTPPGSTATGASATFDHFKQPATYAFHCAIHFGPPNNMVGSVNVVADQHPASVSFGVSPAAPKAGQPVSFTYTGSADPDGTLTSWQWDLDGDGSFETTTPTGAASNTYATPGTLTVRMRVIDDSNEPSATAEQAVTIAAAGSGGSGGPGSGSSGSNDTTAPRATLLKLRGLKLSFRSSERASATATLRARGKTIARGTAKAKSGTLSIRLRLTSAGRKMLPRGHKLRATLTLTLRDSSGNRRSVKRTLTVKRP